MFPEESEQFEEVEGYIGLYIDIISMNKLGIRMDSKELTPHEIEALAIVESAVNKKAKG